MTLQGLTGTLGDLNATQDVPTAGAYCSLDPEQVLTLIIHGFYSIAHVQNVTTFGTACIE